jgi:hypothetical protein
VTQPANASDIEAGAAVEAGGRRIEAGPAVGVG